MHKTNVWMLLEPYCMHLTDVWMLFWSLIEYV